MTPGTRPARRRRRMAREPCSSRLVRSSFVVSVAAMTARHCSGEVSPSGTSQAPPYGRRHPRAFHRGGGGATLPLMTPDQELVLLFGGLHLVALMFACVLFWMFMRSDTIDPWTGDEEDEG